MRFIICLVLSRHVGRHAHAFRIPHATRTGWMELLASCCFWIKIIPLFHLFSIWNMQWSIDNCRRFLSCWFVRRWIRSTYILLPVSLFDCDILTTEVMLHILKRSSSKQQWLVWPEHSPTLKTDKSYMWKGEMVII